MRKTLLLIVAAAALVVALPGCSKSNDAVGNAGGATSTTGQPRSGGTLVVGLTGESSGWSPQADRWGPGPIAVARAIFDPLVVTGEDGQLHPWLAESFESQDKNKTWLIKVRKGISFTNGEPVDGHAVVFNLGVYKKSALTAFAFQPVTDISKVDDYTAKVTLDQEWANFPALFTGQAGFIVAPEMLRNEDHAHPIGSGPFKMQDWTPDNKFVAVKNPNYWRKDAAGRPLPYLDQVTFKPMPDASSRMAALKAGDIDMLTDNSPGALAKVVKGEVPAGFNAIIDESEGDEEVLIINCQTGPTADEGLRKALLLATDRKQISAIYEDAFDIADGPFTKKSPWYSDAGYPEPDMAKAKALVDAWKAKNGGAAPKINIAVIGTADGLQLGQALQSMWRGAGFEVGVDSQEETKFSGTVVGGQFNVLMFQFWNGEDPDINYHFWTGKNVGPEGGISLNFPRWTNAETDAALNAGRAETDPAKRKADYATVWKQWAEHVPYIYLFHAKWAVLARTGVHGIDEVNMPDGKGEAQPLTWGTFNLSNTWVETTK